MAEQAAHRAIDAAFGEIATIHRLMSFHDPDSNLCRLNRADVGNPVEVHAYTHEVLRQAIGISAGTVGCFDVTVGAELVEWELLPRSAGGMPAGTRRVRDRRQRRRRIGITV
jgi:thiamine biosynthesis lipoprotein